VKTSILATVLCLVAAAAATAKNPERPHILGIAGVRIYASNMATARTFYKAAADTARRCDWCGKVDPSAFKLPSGQFILLSPADKDPENNLLAEISFDANHLKELTRLLKSNQIRYTTEKQNGMISIVRLRDPEGHSLVFLEANAVRKYDAFHPTNGPGSVKRERIIHAGFIVNDRTAMDHFYKDILGFHLYWHGGMTDDKTQWVDMQVPDGTDWIEYMLNVPVDADAHTRGVMNHIAIGVPDVQLAAKELEKNGAPLAEQPKIGRDGKWQLNLYDPDQTRVELMEFTPVEKPCCAEYTGPHPKP